MQSGRKVRFGLLGLGRISRKHIDAIQQLSNAEIAAVCDTQLPIAVSQGEKLGVPSYTSLELMLTNESLDIVVVMTPSGLHSSQCQLIAAAGVHVLVEKPMATNWVSALEMVRICQQQQVKLFVVKQNRFNPPVQKALAALRNGKLGRIYFVQANVFWQRPQTYYDQAAWRGTYAMDGGAFMNQASHYIDLVRLFGGEVDSVFASLQTLVRDIEVEDTGCAIVRFRSGALGSINVSILAEPSDQEGSLTILAERGTIKIGGHALNGLLLWEFKEPWVDSTAGQIAEGLPVDGVYGFGHCVYYRNVMNALQGLPHDAVEGEEALKSHELLMTIYESAARSSEVKLSKVESFLDSVELQSIMGDQTSRDL